MNVFISGLQRTNISSITGIREGSFASLYLAFISEQAAASNNIISEINE
jgi:hypothetical protein